MENNSLLTDKRFQFVIKFITAMSFTLFSFYQILLVFKIDSNQIGRLIGVSVYLMITVASYLNFSIKYSVWFAHAVLFVTAILMLFALRLFNWNIYYDNFDPSNTPSVLNFLTYIFSQVGTLVLVAGYLTPRTRIKKRYIRTLVVIFMTVAIILYVMCFIMECVLIIKYRMNIEVNRRYTLLSRFLYCMGYVGIAVCFILPAPKREKKQRVSEFIYSENNEDEIDLIL